MYAVIRFVVDQGTLWRVRAVSQPVPSVNALQVASQIAEEFGMCPDMVDAIFNYPRMPLTVLHAFWAEPYVLDIRPLEQCSSIRHYQLDGDAEVTCVKEERSVGRYKTPHLGHTKTLDPYGLDRFFRPKVDS